MRTALIWGLSALAALIVLYLLTRGRAGAAANGTVLSPEEQKKRNGAKGAATAGKDCTLVVTFKDKELQKASGWNNLDITVKLVHELKIARKHNWTQKDVPSTASFAIFKGQEGLFYQLAAEKGWVYAEQTNCS